MWWCCGKRGKDQPGCKYGKHESKEEDDFGEEFEQSKDANLKYVRCICCKELGHKIEQCTRDPNLRTNAVNELDKDLDRISKIKDFRKLHGDTAIQTTHMIKKAVMIPVETDDDGVPVDKDNTYSPFQRGVMNFDDYNYNVFNQYVLLTGPDEPYVPKDISD